MAVILGTDGYRYEVVDGWAKLPPGYEFNADVAAVGVDKNDNVYAFNRGKHPMCVFDRNGNFLRSWGEGVFLRPHGVHMAPDETIWLTDDGDHTVRQCTLDGKVLLTIGIPGKPAPYMSGEPFHRCTHTALSPQADYLYISDGYGNSRVHKYTPDGKRVMSWGEPGTDPGQFNIAHNICCDPDGWVYVADRENHRVQVFDGNGKYETQWNNMHRPSGLYMESGTKTPRFFVGEIGPDMAVNIDLPNCGPRVSIYTAKGELLARLGHAHAGLEFGPIHFAARDFRRFARRHLCRGGLVHQLGPPRPRQGRAHPAGPQEPAKAGQGGVSLCHPEEPAQRASRRTRYRWVPTSTSCAASTARTMSGRRPLDWSGGWPSIRPAISTDTPLCADPSNWCSINISTASKMLLPPNGKSKAGVATRRRL